jgi:hypothetical protein
MVKLWEVGDGFGSSVCSALRGVGETQFLRRVPVLVGSGFQGWGPMELLNFCEGGRACSCIWGPRFGTGMLVDRILTLSLSLTGLLASFLSS